ncbi:MAG: hypothetical protein EZS28_051775, partial [Streblomastix strix]
HCHSLVQLQVEEVIRAKKEHEGYQVIEIYLELMRVRLDLLDTSKDIPENSIESICGLVFCAGKTEIDYLIQLKDQILKKYGKEIVNRSSQGDEKLVNKRLKEKFSKFAIESQLVEEELKTIAKDNKIYYETPFNLMAQFAESAKVETQQDISPQQQSGFPAAPPSIQPQQYQFQQAPTQPIYQQVPTQPVYGQVPTQPVQPQYGQVPTQTQFPQVPTQQIQPQVPTQQIQPQVPTQSVQPQFPQVPTQSIQPQFPQVPTQSIQPQFSQVPTQPINPLVQSQTQQSSQQSILTGLQYPPQPQKQHSVIIPKPPINPLL